MPHNPLNLLLLAILATLFLCTPAAVAQEEDEMASIDAVLSGVRANAIEGDVLYEREVAKFKLEAALELKEGDIVRTATTGRAELLLQPGNYLRVGADTECQLLSDRYDRLKLQLNKGTISLELLRNEWDDPSNFFDTLKHGYELIRVITPNSEIFITQPGIFRINARADGRTEIIVRRGEALIDGQRVKEKRSATAAKGKVDLVEIDPKVEDVFDVWGRERADKLVETNRSLKKDAPWTKNQKEGSEGFVDLPASEDRGGSPYVVYARPGAVNFVEPGAEFSRRQTGWHNLTEKSKLESADKLRTGQHSFVELTMFPDIYLRISGNSELLFERLSNDSISLKVLRGSAILDAAKFDRKQLPEITIGGNTNSVVVTEEGNYRVDVRGSSDEITIRKGKVIFQNRSIGSCRTIAGGTLSDCYKTIDNFDVWSQHRGEGEFFTGTAMATRLARLRRRRFRNTGFWYQHPMQGQYTFVPFSSTYFRSPYGGSYSSVLSPRRSLVVH
jgi:hypothetical protein